MQQFIMSTTRLTIQTIIGTHHTMHVSLCHQCLKCRQIRIPQIVCIYLGIKRMSIMLWSAMNCIMFGTSYRFQIFGIVSLKSTNHSHTHLRSKIRIFSIRLLSPSPTRITEYIHIGSPISQSSITASRFICFNVLIK